MRVRYTENALRQLDEILNYITQNSPSGARHVSQRIRAIIDLLARHPFAGAVTDRVGQRRMVVSPYPYAIFYRIGNGELIIQRIRHTSRRSI